MACRDVSSSWRGLLVAPGGSSDAAQVLMLRPARRRRTSSRLDVCRSALQVDDVIGVQCGGNARGSSSCHCPA